MNIFQFLKWKKMLKVIETQTIEIPLRLFESLEAIRETFEEKGNYIWHKDDGRVAVISDSEVHLDMVKNIGRLEAENKNLTERIKESNTSLKNSKKYNKILKGTVVNKNKEITALKQTTLVQFIKNKINN